MDGECWKRIEAAARVKKRREKVGRRGGGGQFREGKFNINSRVWGNKRTQREKQKKRKKEKRKKKNSRLFFDGGLHPIYEGSYEG